MRILLLLLGACLVHGASAACPPEGMDRSQLAALRGGLLVGLAISAVVALAVLPLTLLGAVVGLAAVIPGTISNGTPAATS